MEEGLSLLYCRPPLGCFEPCWNSAGGTFSAFGIRTGSSGDGSRLTQAKKLSQEVQVYLNSWVADFCVTLALAVLP